MFKGLIRRCSQLLPSSRPAIAFMPEGVNTHFVETLFFLLAAMEHLGMRYVAHFGTLLGAARLGGPLPWDEDHDIYLIGETKATVEAKLGDLLAQHGFRLVYDAQDFFWVKEKYWLAASGHIGLSFLHDLLSPSEPFPVWEGGAPHLVEGELEPLTTLPFYTSFVWAPQAVENTLQRIYEHSGSPQVMARFKAPPLSSEAQEFWARARTPERLDWEAISARFRHRSRWHHLRFVPWWWFNGGYIILINKLRRWAQKRSEPTKP